MAPFSLIVADMSELDNGGGVGHGHHPVAAGNSYLAALSSSRSLVVVSSVGPFVHPSVRVCL